MGRFSHDSPGAMVRRLPAFILTQAIPQACFGDQVVGPMWQWLQLAAQIPDTDPQAAGVAEVSGPPHFANELGLPDNQAGVTGQRFQHSILERRQVQPGVGWRLSYAGRC